MERTVMDKLRSWYDSMEEQILFIVGAPFVGKSWLIEKLCRENGEDYIKISADNLLEKELLKERLSEKKLLCEDVQRIGIIIISDVNDKKTFERAKRIILRIRSEASVGYYRFIVESRLVGNESLLKHLENERYVRVIRVYPMNLKEFMDAIKIKGMPDIVDILRVYMYIGGLPECIACFLKTGSLTTVREYQDKLLKVITDSFGSKCGNILKAIPHQLIKSEKTFTYKSFSRNAREREYGQCIDKLEGLGVICRINRLEDTGFRLYLYDVGLLAAALCISKASLIKEDEIFKVHRGVFVKCFIAEEYLGRHMRDMRIFYWNRKRAKAKLPFVIKDEDDKLSVLQLCMGISYDRSVQSFCENHCVTKVYKIHIDAKKCHEIKANDKKLKLYDIAKVFSTK